jgi:ADP-ribose pyrophosphatase
MLTPFAQMTPPAPTFRFRDFRVERRGYLTTYSISDGRRRWDLIERGHAVAVLPVDWQRREVYLVEQPRVVMAFERPEVSERLNEPTAEVSGDIKEIMSLEAPSGMIEPGEEPTMTALRELKEETGIVLSPEALSEVCCYFASIGAMTETTRCYLADVPPGFAHAQPQGDGDEHITVWKVPFEEYFSALESGRVRTASAVILAQELRHRAAIRA